jgi:hypothetical protein
LNIEEAAVNPGTDSAGNSNNSNVKETKSAVPINREVAKAKNHRKVEVSPLPFLMVNKDQLVLSVAKWSTLKYHVV